MQDRWAMYTENRNLKEKNPEIKNSITEMKNIFDELSKLDLAEEGLWGRGNSIQSSKSKKRTKTEKENPEYSMTVG